MVVTMFTQHDIRNGRERSAAARPARPEREIGRQVLIAVAVDVAYLVWRVAASHGGVPAWAWMPLLVAESIAIARFVLLASVAWRVRDVRVAPDEAAGEPVTPERPELLVPAIDVTTDELARTLISASLLDVARVRVLLAVRSRSLESEAVRLGASVERHDLALDASAPAATRRAALIDAALASVATRTAAWVDAGDVALRGLPELAERLTGDVVVVQSAHDFVNRDSLVHLVADRDERAFDSQVVHPAMGRLGAAPWLGSGSVFDVAALRDAGGLSDGRGSATSRAAWRLLRGKRTISFEPTPLVRTVAPDTLADYLSSVRADHGGTWAALFGPDSPLWRRGLPARRRAAALLGATAPLDGLVRALAVCSLALVLVTGRSPVADAAVGGLAVAVATLLRVRAVHAMGRGTFGHVDRMCSGLRTMGANLAALAGRHGGGAARSVASSMLALTSTIVVLDLAVIARVATWAWPAMLPRVGGVAAVASLGAAVVVIGAGASTLGVLALRRQRRSQYREPSHLDGHLDGIAATTSDLTALGAGFVLDRPMTEGDVVSFALSVPHRGTHVAVTGLARIVHSTPVDDGSIRVGVRFDGLTRTDRDVLVEHCLVGDGASEPQPSSVVDLTAPVRARRAMAAMCAVAIVGGTCSAGLQSAGADVAPTDFTGAYNPIVATEGWPVPSPQTAPFTCEVEPCTFTALDPLPAGITLDSSTGEVGGHADVWSPDAGYRIQISDSNEPPATAVTSIQILVNDAMSFGGYQYVVARYGQAVDTQTPTYSGGTAGYSFTVSPGLPNGISLDGGTGQLSGTLWDGLTAGTYTYTVSLTDSAGAVLTSDITIEVQQDNIPDPDPGETTTSVEETTTTQLPRPGITGYSNTTATVGQWFQLGAPQIDCPNGGCAVWISPGLPNGLSIDSSSGTISGTPWSTSSNQSYTVTVGDQYGDGGSTSFDLEVREPEETTTTSPPMTPGISGYSQLVVTQGSWASTGQPSLSCPVGGCWFSVSPSLPDGLSIDGSGTISGYPSSSPGRQTYTVTVTDWWGQSASTTLDIEIDSNEPSVSGYSSNTIQVGSWFSMTPSVSCPMGSCWLTVSPGLPSGLNLDSWSGAIEGTASSSSSNQTYTVTVTDGMAHTASTTFDLQVDEVPTNPGIWGYSDTSLQHGSWVSLSPPSISCPVGGCWVSVSPSLPSGLSLDSWSGAISGTADGWSAWQPYTVTVADWWGQTASTSFSLEVTGPVTFSSGYPIQYTRVGSSVDTGVPGYGGGTGPYSFDTMGVALPDGLQLDPSTGAITGQPTSTLSMTTFPIQVTDGGGATASTTVAFDIDVAIPTISTYGDIDATAGVAVTPQTPSLGCWNGGCSLEISPQLPGGLTFDTATGTIAGTATGASGEQTYMVTVTDSLSQTASATVQVEVFASPSFNGAYGDLMGPTWTWMSQTAPSVDGGAQPLTYAVSRALPAGLSLDASSGEVSGLVGSAGSATFTITATDANGATAATTLYVEAWDPPPVPPTVSGYSDMRATAWFAVDAQTPAVVCPNGGCSLSISPSLPDGLSLDTSDGTVAGAAWEPAADDLYTVTVVDALSMSATTSFHLSVNAPPTFATGYPAVSATVGQSVGPVGPNVSGGVDPLVFTVSPALPAGLSLSPSTGALSGTPTTPVASDHTVTVTDHNGASATTVLSLSVAAATTTTTTTTTTTATSTTTTTTTTTATTSTTATPTTTTPTTTTTTAAPVTTAPAPTTTTAPVTTTVPPSGTDPSPPPTTADPSPEISLVAQQDTLVEGSGYAVFTFDVPTGFGATCRLDDGATTPCVSPMRYFGLSAGRHTLTVELTSVLGIHETRAVEFTVAERPAPRSTVPASPAEPSVLAATGTYVVEHAGLALAMVLAGAALVLVARRRRG